MRSFFVILDPLGKFATTYTSTNWLGKYTLLLNASNVVADPFEIKLPFKVGSPS